jgi:hypothetical protein
MTSPGTGHPTAVLHSARNATTSARVWIMDSEQDVDAAVAAVRKAFETFSLTSSG